MGLRLAQQTQHIGVTVDDPGGGGEQRAGTGKRGLQRLRLRGGERLKIIHPIGGGPRADAPKLVQLRRICGHDQLAAALVRQATFGQIGIERPAPRHAEAGHEAALRIVNPRMDHLAVAGRGLRAEARGFFEDQHLAPGQRQRAGHGQPHHARARDDAIDLFQVGLPRQSAPIFPAR